MKNKEYKKGILIFLLLFIALFNINANALLFEAISSSSISELQSMASLRGIDYSSLSEGELRSKIYEFESLEEIIIDNNCDESTYRMKIQNANEINILSNSNILLSGNVVISFNYNDSEVVLKSDRMLLDTKTGSVSAYGGVQYVDKKENTTLSEISASIVTYVYKNGDLYVSQGTTESDRKNDEKQDIKLYTNAELLNFRAKDEGIFFSSGEIKNSLDEPLSSISAKNIALLEDGDMFLSNAKLKLGRIPIFYLPFFFFPGSTLDLNPALGFESARGIFLSLTYEVFGKYPDFKEAEEGSFASILKNTNDTSKFKSNGIYYDNIERETLFDKFASKTNSYLTLLFDAYEKSGVHLGLSTLLKDKDSRYKLTSNSGVSLQNRSVRDLDSEFRYYSINQLDLNYNGLSLKFNLPYYSDPYSYYDYQSRLTSFSLFSIFGDEQKFPASGSSIKDYNISLVSKYNLDSKYTNQYLSSFSISNLNLNAKYTYDDKEKKYNVSNIILPSLNLNLSGKIINKSKNVESQNIVKEEKVISYSDYFILSDPLLFPLYENKSEESKKSSSERVSLNISYSLNEKLDNLYDYSKENNRLENGNLTNNLNGKLTFDFKVGSFITFNQTYTPSHSYNFNEKNKESESTSFTLKHTNDINIPFLGLSYSFNANLYQYNLKKEQNKIISEKEMSFTFTKDNITKHSLTYKNSFKSKIGTFTPSIVLTLYPIDSTITANLGYKYDDLTLSISQKLKKEEDKYTKESLKLSIGYLSTYFTSSLSVNYDYKKESDKSIYDPIGFSSSISIRTKDKRYSLTHSTKYEHLKNDKRVNFESLNTKLIMPYLTITYSSSYVDNEYKKLYLDFNSNINNIITYSWKNRIVNSLSLSSNFHFVFDNPYANSFTLSLTYQFKIEEFISLKLSLVTKNSSFYKYYVDDEFKFSLLLDDLKRSLDFINKGRYSTSFNMESVNFELIHYMSDWNFYCKYTATIVSSSKGYYWQPAISFYLKWNTLPDLKIDENYKKTETTWVVSESVYSKK